MTFPVLELEHVTHRFADVDVLCDVSLTVTAGERLALIGPSGAGKSTLLSLLNGSLTPTAGTVRILGQPLARLRPRARRRVQAQVGMVYQQYHLVENLAVIHNVNAGCLGHWPLWKALWSLMWPQNVANVQQVLNLVGLPEKLRTRTGALSGGQQQRVALARVLAQNPAVILADEPISNLDRERSQALMDLLRNLVVQANRTLVVSLHAIEFVSTHFQRVIGLRHGRVLWDMPAETLTATHIEQLYSLK